MVHRCVGSLDLRVGGPARNMRFGAEVVHVSAALRGSARAGVRLPVAGNGVVVGEINVEDAGVGGEEPFHSLAVRVYGASGVGSGFRDGFAGHDADAAGEVTRSSSTVCRLLRR